MAIFQQDGDPTPYIELARRTNGAPCQLHFLEFWAMGEKPEGSLDLFLTENLRAVVHETMTEMVPGRSRTLAEDFRTAWSSINSTLPDNLVSSMLHRLLGSVREKGKYIGTHKLVIFAQWKLEMCDINCGRPAGRTSLGFV